MRQILIIAEDSDKAKELTSGLKQKGLVDTVVSRGEEITKLVTKQSPDVILVTLEGRSGDTTRLTSARKIKEERLLPVIAIIEKNILDRTVLGADIDDFIVAPPDINELSVRINRLLQRPSGTGTETVKSGDMVIDLARCEVSIKSKPVHLAFKEYELLKFLASNPGRVYSRDAILNKVWGYDYYGGDRTVDVHIRRLRSKIEESSGQSYIETVRNIGYRFKGGKRTGA